MEIIVKITVEPKQNSSSAQVQKKQNRRAIVSGFEMQRGIISYSDNGFDEIIEADKLLEGIKSVVAYQYPNEHPHSYMEQEKPKK